MGRMHAPGKGISQSALPYRRSVPSWLKLNADDVKEQIKKLGKKGMTPSQIGIILRDSHGVAQVRFVNGNKVGVPTGWEPWGGGILLGGRVSQKLDVNSDFRTTKERLGLAPERIGSGRFRQRRCRRVVDGSCLHPLF